MSRSGCWICFSAVWSLVCTVYFHKFQFPALRPSVARFGNFKYLWLLATASQRHWWVISNLTIFCIVLRFLCSAKQEVSRICRNPVFGFFSMFRRSLQAARRTDMTQYHAKSKVFKGSIKMLVMVVRVIRTMVVMTMMLMWIWLSFLQLDEFFEILLIHPGHHPRASNCSLQFEHLDIVFYSFLFKFWPLQKWRVCELCGVGGVQSSPAELIDWVQLVKSTPCSKFSSKGNEILLAHRYTCCCNQNWFIFSKYYRMEYGLVISVSGELNETQT